MENFINQTGYLKKWINLQGTIYKCHNISYTQHNDNNIFGNPIRNNSVSIDIITSFGICTIKGNIINLPKDYFKIENRLYESIEEWLLENIQ